MLWFGVMALCAVIFVIGLFGGFIFSKPRAWDDGGGETYGGGGTGMTIFGICFLFSAFVAGCSTITASTESVDTGHVGVLYTFGQITGQTEDGLVWHKPWENVKQANVQVQYAYFEDIAAASAETQDVFFDVTINFSVSPVAVQRLYETVGADYYKKLIEPRVYTLFKDEAVAYNAVDVTTKRDELRLAVRQRLVDELSPYSITVSDVLIVNIGYSPQFNESIESKQVATQNALRAQEQVKQKEFEAAQARAEAQGVADSILIRAKGQADANLLLSASLTDRVIQYEAIQRLNPNVQTILIPSDSDLILPGDLINRP